MKKERASQLSYIKPQTSEQLLLFIVGPTASGKSDAAMRIAQKYNGEIICADSQTIRRGLDIGTAKPSKQDQVQIPHHMLDVIDPYDRYSVADFVEAANKSIAAIQKLGKLPIVVGGTGLYVDALMYGFGFRPMVSTAYLRLVLEQKSVEELQELIQKEGYSLPENSQNPRHLIRVLESSGAQSKKQSSRCGAMIIGINPPKETIEKRIKARVDTMVADGFFDEVENMIMKWGVPKLKIDAIAYNIALQHRIAANNYDEELFKEKLFIAERQYVKRQRSWFKRNDEILWFSSGDAAVEHIINILH